MNPSAWAPVVAALVAALVPLIGITGISLGALIKAWMDAQTAKFQAETNSIHTRIDQLESNQSAILKQVNGRLSDAIQTIPSAVSEGIRAAGAVGAIPPASSPTRKTGGQ